MTEAGEKKPEIGRMPFDELSAAIGIYKLSQQPYWRADYITRAHTEEGFSTLTGEQFEKWKADMPKPDDETMARLTDEYRSARSLLIEQLKLETEDVLDGIVTAHDAIAKKEDKNLRQRWPGLTVPFGSSHPEFAAGVIEVSKLTGDTYKIHTGDVNTPCYEIHPTSSIEELFPTPRAVYDETLREGVIYFGKEEDLYSGRQILDLVNDILSRDNVTRLIYDLSINEYIDSTIVGVIISSIKSGKNMDVKVALLNKMGKMTKKSFKICGLDHLLEIVDEKGEIVDGFWDEK